MKCKDQGHKKKPLSEVNFDSGLKRSKYRILKIFIFLAIIAIHFFCEKFVNIYENSTTMVYIYAINKIFNYMDVFLFNKKKIITNRRKYIYYEWFTKIFWKLEWISKEILLKYSRLDHVGIWKRKKCFIIRSDFWEVVHTENFPETLVYFLVSTNRKQISFWKLSP